MLGLLSESRPVRFLERVKDLSRPKSIVERSIPQAFDLLHMYFEEKSFCDSEEFAC